MKKISFIIGLSLLTFNLFGQTAAKEYGVKAGVNYSQYTPDLEFNGRGMVDFSGRFGFFVGGYYNLGLTPKVRVQPELLFALQGTNISQEMEVRAEGQAPVVGTLKSRVTESTVLLPVLLQLYASERFYFEVGPQFAYIVDRDEQVTEDPFTETGRPTGSGEDCAECDKFDFGASLGVGYKFGNQFGINARYFAGLIERNNVIKSSVFHLGLSYGL